ncbi:hypothetical protein F441_02757 [Phytophthora nicotianae CJ01A1]|uniref:Uncharacterized protein n=1 Tax=Phytophthora nicotianae CJ01A1 TaxID=1317063 RepID=W2XP10_PHYNI|nr:hypothetical protein F441_02757 [Phytophthora nicotianae CJ01A1]
MIEEKAGSNEKIDGTDGGEDDDELLRHVESIARDRNGQQCPNGGIEDRVSVEGSTNDMAMGEAASDSDRTGRERLREARELNVEPQNEDSTLISEQTDDSSDRFPNATSLGTIATGQGSEFSQDIDGWESYMGEEKIEEDSQLELLGAVLIEARDRPAGTDRHNSRVVREICLDSNGSLDASSGRDRVGSLSADSETRRSETPAQRKSFRRDPRNAAHDANETSKQKGLSRASNRLGGQDLSIVRDNFHEMGGRIARAKHKRTSSEPSPPPTFVVSKRTKAGSAWTTSANSSPRTRTLN